MLFKIFSIEFDACYQINEIPSHQQRFSYQFLLLRHSQSDHFKLTISVEFENSLKQVEINKNMKLLIISLLLFSCESNEAVTVDCDYAADGTHGYYCEVMNSELITLRHDRKVEEVRGIHLNGKDNTGVKHFHSIFKKVKYFPRGIAKIFKNIESVLIYSADLQEVSKYDLQEFGENLKDLRLAGNEIEVLDGDLFTYNKNLKQIYLSNNKIKHIDTRIFVGLKKLDALFLYANICTSNNFISIQTHRSEFLENIKEVEDSCKMPINESFNGEKSVKQEDEALKLLSAVLLRLKN